jgi:hypothetical protein
MENADADWQDLEEAMPMYMKYGETVVRESATVSKSMDSATTLLCQYATLGSSPFDAYSLDAQSDGTASDGSVVIVSDPVAADYGGALNITIGDLNAFKPLFAWTTPDLL